VKVSLGAARAATMRPGGALVVFTEGGTGRIASMDPVKGIVGPNGSFGAATGITDTWVAATRQSARAPSVGTGGGGVTPPPGDGGDEAGTSPDPKLHRIPPTHRSFYSTFPQRQPSSPSTRQPKRRKRPSHFPAYGDLSRRTKAA